MKKIFILLGLIFLIGCKEEVRFKPITCYAPPEPEILPVDVVNGIISGQNKDNVSINWYNVWSYIDELKKHCGIKDYKDLAKELGVPERYVKSFLSRGLQYKPATLEFGEEYHGDVF